MNKDAVLSFIKKNMVGLACGIVAILAVVAVFYPLGGMISELQGEADQSGSLYNQLNQLVTRQRKLPMSDPNQTDPGILPMFPNPTVIKKGQDANAAWVQQTKETLQKLQQLNQAGHELLVADELPNPQSQTTYIYFATLYKLVLSTEPTVSAVGDPNAKPPVPVDPNLQPAHRLNLRNDVLNGGSPPTLDDVKKAADDLKQSKYVPRYITLYQNGVATIQNQPAIDAEFAQDAATLPMRMQRETARTHKIYVEKDAFTQSPTILPDVPPQLPDMWYAQMQLWIQQDLAAAIQEENSSATNVFDAPVKRLLSMQIPASPMYVFPPASSATGGGGGGAGPAAVGGTPAAAKETDPIPPNYAVSVTGRYSNGMYDVVPFRLVVDVDTRKVNEFIGALSHNRMITVTSQNMFALDTEAEAQKGYLYGPNSTVRLVLDGETMFLRSWTLPLMPERVKQALGLAPAGGLGQTPAGGPGGAPGAPPFGRSMGVPPSRGG